MSKMTDIKLESYEHWEGASLKPLEGTIITYKLDGIPMSARVSRPLHVSEVETYFGVLRKQIKSNQPNA